MATLIDAGFSASPTTLYQLIIGINRNSAQLLVFDPEKNRFVAFSQKDFQYLGGNHVYFGLLKSFLKENELFVHDYKDTLVLWETQRSTLVPDALFENSEPETYFYFNQVNENDEKICIDRLRTAEVANVFAIPSNFDNDLSLKSCRIRHHASVFIESCMISSKHHMMQKQVFVDVHSSFFDMLVSENGRLLFYNSFAYKTAEDFIYFVLFVYNQLKLSPETDGIILSGTVLKNLALYDILYKYMRKIEFANPGDQYINSYILKDIPAHTIKNLTEAVLCEL